MIFGWSVANKGKIMNVIKHHLKLFIGIAVLILFIFMFFFFQKSSDLESNSMSRWASVSIERRTAAIKILTGGDADNEELMLQCMNKVASLPDSKEMSIRDCATLCYTGIKLKQNI